MMYTANRKDQKKKIDKIDWFPISPNIGEETKDIVTKFTDLVEKDCSLYVDRYAEGYQGGNPSRLQDALKEFFRTSRDGRRMVIAIINHGRSGDGGFEDSLKPDEFGDDPQPGEPERFWWTPAMLWNGRSEFSQLSPFLGLRSIICEALKRNLINVTVFCAQCYGGDFATFLHQQVLGNPLEGKLTKSLEIKQLSYGPTFPCALCEKENDVSSSRSAHSDTDDGRNVTRRPCAVNDDVIDWLKSLAEGTEWNPDKSAGLYGKYITVDKKIKI